MAEMLDTNTLRRVPFDRPWDWLAAGWRDVWQKPGISIGYGLIAVAIGLVLSMWLLGAGLESLIPVLAGGFLLIAPLLAVGLYEKSRALAANEYVSFGSTLTAAWRAIGRLSPFAAALLIIYLVWVRLAFLLFSLFLGTSGLPPAHEFMPTLLFTAQGLGLLVVGTAIGAVLAAIVFAISAISIPMLMDRNIDAVTAMVRSAKAVIDNPRPMGLWAILIAGFMALGIATMGLGLVLAFPLIGHATWHAYRDFVSPAATDARG